ncbi:hypothetical protein D0866_11234 [Hortaea werneckii]|uniref:Homeobox domain-containing protein n=1 Tax=Hortaea werneckii TaxID=91943 RepID=A0A3M7ACE0_HORWE|nr:hypothetical protein D0866_11234 [Hortaea werneckii]
MESLTLSDFRGSTRFPAPVTYDRSPRLPTPEASCSGSEGIGNSSSRRQSRHRTSLNDTPFSSTMDCYKTGSRSLASPRRLHTTPHSPPVQFSESQKPSLPPLKTVLASSITSPPQSPTAAPSALQPRPCEPAYTTSTYKPPSLYPSKKQRTEPLPECYPLTRPGTMSPSRTASCSRHPGYACPADGSHCFSSAGDDMRAPRRLSVQQPPHIPSHPFGPSMTPEKCPGLVSREPSIDGTRSGRIQMFKPVHVASSHDHDVHDLSVHRTMNAGFPSPHEANDDDPRSRTLPYHAQFTPRESHGSGIDNTRLAKRDCWPAPQASSSPYGGYESPQSQYFMQAHYEYSHGKTRKRSNLPKQSTEIMKTWFDENMSNPYPSEEQKALFSKVRIELPRFRCPLLGLTKRQATGISMTQVSNWFINHRRRCPELRDKRERGRVGGRDFEM